MKVLKFLGFVATVLLAFMGIHIIFEFIEYLLGDYEWILHVALFSWIGYLAWNNFEEWMK